MVDSIITPLSTGGMTPEEQKAHDDKMAKVAEDGATTLTATDVRKPEDDVTLTQEPATDDGKVKRPDDVPEKFWDAEKGEVNVAALLKSQKDGEEALRAKSNDSLDDDPNKNKAPADKSNDLPDDSKVVDAASAEFAEKGELSEETFKSLETAGLSRGMVTDYIEGQQALVTNLQAAAYGEFEGGKETYKAAAEWATDNLNEEEIKAIDVQVTSRNPGIVKQGAIALAAKYAANADVSPDITITGGGNADTAGAHFKSSAEMQAAMNDPKYKSDPAFRAEVSAKIAGAERAGVNLFV